MQYRIFEALIVLLVVLSLVVRLAGTQSVVLPALRHLTLLIRVISRLCVAAGLLLAPVCGSVARLAPQLGLCVGLCLGISLMRILPAIVREIIGARIVRLSLSGLRSSMLRLRWPLLEYGMLVGGAAQIGIGRCRLRGRLGLIGRGGDIGIKLGGVSGARIQRSGWPCRALGRALGRCGRIGLRLRGGWIVTALLGVRIGVAGMGLLGMPVTCRRRCGACRCGSWALRCGLLRRGLRRGVLMSGPRPRVGIDIITAGLRRTTCGQRL